MLDQELEVSLVLLFMDGILDICGGSRGHLLDALQRLVKDLTEQRQDAVQFNVENPWIPCAQAFDRDFPSCINLEFGIEAKHSALTKQADAASTANDKESADSYFNLP
jgi:hypothetical protein